MIKKIILCGFLLMTITPIKSTPHLLPYTHTGKMGMGICGISLAFGVAGHFVIPKIIESYKTKRLTQWLLKNVAVTSSVGISELIAATGMVIGAALWVVAELVE